MPLATLPDVLANLHQSGFRQAFEADEVGVLAPAGNHLKPTDLSILQEIYFEAESDEQNCLCLYVCECMDGQIGYLLLNKPCAFSKRDLQLLLSEIPRVEHDEFRPVFLNSHSVDMMPQLMGKSAPFKAIFA